MNINFKELIKKNLIAIIIFTVISALLGVYFAGKIGLKDAGMVTLSTLFLLFEIYLIRKNTKLSILMFMTTFPILVTARKICYIDFFFIKLTYESIYVLIFTILNFKKIINTIFKYLNRKHSLQFKYIVWTFIFIIFSLNSCFFSDNPMESLANFYLSVLIPVIFGFAILTYFESKDRYYIYYALIAGIDFSCLYGIFQIVSNRLTLSTISKHRNIVTFGYNNINIFAGILVIIVPLLLEMVLYRKNNKNEKLFLYFSLLLDVLSLMLTFSRGAWITFILTVFIILLSKRFRFILYAIVPPALLFSKKIFMFILYRGRISAEFFKNESIIARVLGILTSFKIILMYPFGAGEGNFTKMYDKFALSGLMVFPYDVRRSVAIPNYHLEMAHNLWLQIMVDFGIISCIAFIIIIIIQLKGIFRDFKTNRGLFASLAAYLIFSLSTGIEFNHKGIITETLIIWALFSIIQMNIKIEGADNEKID